MLEIGPELGGQRAQQCFQGIAVTELGARG
jgi:hypothetical protein